MQKNIKLILSLLFIFMYGTFYHFHNNDINERIKLELDSKLNDLKVHHSLSLDYFYNDAKSIKSMIIADPIVKSTLKVAFNSSKKEQSKLRAKLYNYLLPMYKRIHTRGILQFHFVFPNNKTFLRVHKPNKFGDDLTNIRYSYKYVNDMKKTVYGFEQGKTVHAVRYVFPIFDETKKHIGSAEVSLSTKYLQDRLENSNKLHTHYIVNKNIFEVKVWKEPGIAEKYIQSVESDDYMYTLTSHNYDKVLGEEESKYIKNKRDEIKNKLKSSEPFSIYIPIKNNVKVVSFLPIKNIKDKRVVAYLVAYTNSNAIYSIIEDSKKILISMFIILIILFYFLFLIINNRDKLKIEVDSKTKELKELNENLEIKIINEVQKNQKIQEQLYKSEKMASMGEMIGNIAHQWRQPLSVISTSSSGIVLQKEHGILTDDLLIESCNAITNNTKYLSKTIDDFKDYIKGDKIKKQFNLKILIDSFLNLVNGSIKCNSINIVLDLQENIKINGYDNELIQCFMNIFNNSKDALNEVENKYIFIFTSIENDKVLIKIRDNAGGIDSDIVSKVFEPYFTTKHKSQGTGLGLHMTYNLIVDGMNGTIEVINKDYEYNEIEYTGAEFVITLPLD